VNITVINDKNANIIPQLFQ